MNSSIPDPQDLIRNALANLLSAAKLAPQQPDELTISKTLVSTPNGGTYLMALVHIDGPKLKLSEYVEFKPGEAEALPEEEG